MTLRAYLLVFSPVVVIPKKSHPWKLLPQRGDAAPISTPMCRRTSGTSAISQTDARDAKRMQEVEAAVERVPTRHHHNCLVSVRILGFRPEQKLNQVAGCRRTGIALDVRCSETTFPTPGPFMRA